MKIKSMCCTMAVTMSVIGGAQAQPPAGNPVPVTVDNFIRAESDLYMGNLAKEAGGLAKLQHRREPASIDQQTVIRLNRDTLYTSAIFDLDAGPVTIALPDAGTRFMSLMVVSQDHYTTTVYGAGPHTIDKDKVGTRYALVGIRTLVDPADPKDVAQVHKLQDAIKVSQKGNRHARTAELGSGQPEEGSRCAARPWFHDARLQESVRHQGSGRSNSPFDRDGAGLGRQS